jgi:hypothetical protein
MVRRLSLSRHSFEQNIRFPIAASVPSYVMPHSLQTFDILGFRSVPFELCPLTKRFPSFGLSPQPQAHELGIVKIQNG